MNFIFLPPALPLPSSSLPRRCGLAVWLAGWLALRLYCGFLRAAAFVVKSIPHGFIVRHAGGSSMFPGLQQRLARELDALAWLGPTAAARVLAEGGSAVAAATAEGGRPMERSASSSFAVKVRSRSSTSLRFLALFVGGRGCMHAGMHGWPGERS